MSSSTTSGRNSRTTSSADAPSAASPTTLYPADSSTVRAHVLNPGWSSTIRTFTSTSRSWQHQLAGASGQARISGRSDRADTWPPPKPGTTMPDGDHTTPRQRGEGPAVRAGRETRSASRPTPQRHAWKNQWRDLSWPGPRCFTPATALGKPGSPAPVGDRRRGQAPAW